MSLQFTSAMWVYVLGATFGLVLAYQSWRLHPAHGARLWSVVMLFAGTWCVGEMFVLSVTTLPLKILAAKFLYIGIIGTPFSWFLFAVYYSTNGRWLKARNIFLVSVIPLLTLVLVFTLERHTWFYKEIVLHDVAGLIVTKKVYGVWFWVWSAYAYTIIIGGALVLVRSVIRFPALFHGQVLWLLLAAICPIFSNVLYLTGNNPFAPYDPSPLAFALSGGFVMLSLLRYRFLDITPTALDLVYQRVNNGVMVVDLRKRVSNVNPKIEEIFGVKADELIGEIVWEKIPFLHELEEDLAPDASRIFEVTIEETMCTYELELTTLHSRFGRHIGWLLLFYDITALKLVSEELDAYAHTVAHDLKAPLTVIRGYERLLVGMFEKGEYEGAIQKLHRIDEYVLRMRNIIDELLLLASIRQSKEIAKRTFSMEEPVRSALERYKPLLERVGAHVDVIDEWPSVVGHAPWVEEVWCNFISNAMKYGGTPPKIELGIRVVNGVIRFYVTDNGKGLTQEEKAEVFSKFSRLDNVRAEGHGLGLSIVKRIIERLNGTLGVEDAPGGGCTFWFTLPPDEEER
ncbi:MAG: hypothetical protein CL920_35970 [Deltaproteobacteria bacterium]|mgnify:CR=1 FL=1|nr:hypothetical protein [Deltaproteobacteria bacterium]MBU54125.1 hypothetical protein [Deltaproteobacteria bacterium]